MSLIAHGLSSADADADVVLSNVTRTRFIRCASDTCDSMILLHLGSLHYPRYSFGLTFSGKQTTKMLMKL